VPGANYTFHYQAEPSCAAPVRFTDAGFLPKLMTLDHNGMNLWVKNTAMQMQTFIFIGWISSFAIHKL
jgi:hypothetical protein